jgi:hypothetical protein
MHRCIGVFVSLIVWTCPVSTRCRFSRAHFSVVTQFEIRRHMTRVGHFPIINMIVNDASVYAELVFCVFIFVLCGMTIMALDSIYYTISAVPTSRRLECLRRAQTPQRHGGRLRGAGRCRGDWLSRRAGSAGCMSTISSRSIDRN